MEFNNDPKLLQANEVLNARLIAQNELISELKEINQFLLNVIKELANITSINCKS